eukprot:TRINITY_DN2297_c3_g1_i1.p1 TRINITY_DN2297_c3_g1~~TRINITY_DN2297_c3_g1_i1.p1  ORF type:complete len:190 (+),score=38.67 TRINITY_DN2297_c3_g1_i1:93-662(+)
MGSAEEDLNTLFEDLGLDVLGDDDLLDPMMVSPIDDLTTDTILDKIEERPRTPPMDTFDRPLFGHLQKAYTAEAPTNLEWGMLGGLPLDIGQNLALNSLLLPSHTLVPTLMNPYDPINGLDMLAHNVPPAPIQHPEALPEDDAAPTRRRRRKKRKPKRDRKNDPQYWATRPQPEECVIVPIQEGVAAEA